MANMTKTLDISNQNRTSDDYYFSGLWQCIWLHGFMATIHRRSPRIPYPRSVLWRSSYGTDILK